MQVQGRGRLGPHIDIKPYCVQHATRPHPLIYVILILVLERCTVVAGPLFSSDLTLSEILSSCLKTAVKATARQRIQRIDVPLENNGTTSHFSRLGILHLTTVARRGRSLAAPPEPAV